MTENRYGARKITKMYRQWNDLRSSIASGEIEKAQAAFDKCEEWVDYAFGKNSTSSPEANADPEGGDV